MGAKLHLIEPLGFSLDEKALKRAGLDYWKDVDCTIYKSLEDFWKQYPVDARHFFFSTKSDKPYFQNRYRPWDFLYFGREDAGLREDLMTLYAKNTYTIPIKNIRSLNLATAVGIVLFEGIRQNFEALEL